MKKLVAMVDLGDPEALRKNVETHYSVRPDLADVQPSVLARLEDKNRDLVFQKSMHFLSWFSVFFAYAFRVCLFFFVFGVLSLDDTG